MALHGYLSTSTLVIWGMALGSWFHSRGSFLTKCSRPALIAPFTKVNHHFHLLPKRKSVLLPVSSQSELQRSYPQSEPRLQALCSTRNRNQITQLSSFWNWDITLLSSYWAEIHAALLHWFYVEWHFIKNKSTCLQFAPNCKEN